MTGGTIKSEPGFAPALNSEFVGIGNDYIRSDVDGKRLRLDAHGVVKYVDRSLTFLSTLSLGSNQRLNLFDVLQGKG